MPSPAYSVGLRHGASFIHASIGPANQTSIRQGDGAIWSTMWSRLRLLVVAMVVALGLIVPGMAMASGGMSAGHSPCQAAHAGCADAGGNHHTKLSGSPCRVVCVPTAALRTPGFVIRPVLWAAQVFNANPTGIPLGRSVAPDPLPPRPLPPI